MEGEIFLTNDTVLNEKELTLRVDLISSICWKGQLSEEDIIKEAFDFNDFMGKRI